MKRTDRVAARLVAPVLTAARASGADVLHLLEAAGVDKGFAGKSGIDEHVTLAQYFRVWEQAVARSAPGLPLRAATVLGIESFGVIGFALMTSPTIGDSFATVTRYYRMLNTASRWSERKEPPHVGLVFEIQPGPPLATRSAIEFALAESVHVGGLTAGRRIPLVEVRFPHPAPRDEAPYRAYFKAPLRWNAPRATLVLDRAALKIPLLRADPVLRAYFQAKADDLAARHADEEELSVRVRRLIMDALPSGPPAPEAIARHMGLSDRSLRRHLLAEETSFSTLVEETRREMAKQYLQDPKLSVSEIAFLVGFSELSPFQRAFRRWTNLSPRAYRKRAVGAALRR